MAKSAKKSKGKAAAKTIALTQTKSQTKPQVKSKSTAQARANGRPAVFTKVAERLQLSGPALIVIAALVWSLDGILRAGLYSIPPATLVLLEHALGLLFLSPFLFRGWQSIRKATRSTLAALVVTSILGGAIGTIFYTAALAQVQFVPFSVVVLMQQTQPLFAVALSALILREKLTGKFIVAGIFALIGVYLVSFPELRPNLGTVSGTATATAALLALGAAAAWGSATVFSKHVLNTIDYRVATTYRFLITTIVVLVLSFVLKQTFPLASITGGQWLQLLLIVFSAGMVGMVIYYRGLSKTPAHVSTFAELAWPLSAFAIDLIRGVSFAPTQLAGSVVLIAMIYRISQEVRAPKPKLANPFSAKSGGKTEAKAITKSPAKTTVKTTTKAAVKSATKVASKKAKAK